jgi:hypothetical protein
MSAYSFQNVNATLVGPGGVVNFGNGSGAAEEGITIEPVGDKNQMVIGADGSGQHSLIASDAVSVTLRLLKTSPQNKALMIMYDLQSVSSALWGINVITVVDSGRNDYTVVTGVAFKKKPTLNYAQDGGLMEWTFDGINGNTLLGSS